MKTAAMVLSVSCLYAVAQTVAPPATTSATDSKTEFKTSISTAAELLEQGDFVNAQDAYRAACKPIQDQDVECRLGRAELALRFGTPFVALIHVDAGLRLMEAKDVATELKLRRMRVKALAELGTGEQARLLEAGDELDRILQLEAADGVPLYQKGVMFLKHGEIAGGRKALQQYAERFPNGSKRALAERYLSDPQSVLLPHVPVTQLRDRTGQSVYLLNNRKEVIVLDFWATWCQPCIEQLPALKQLKKRWEGKPVKLISISADKTEAEWTKFIDAEKMDWTQVWDKDMTTFNAFEMHAFPEFAVISRSGVVLKKWGDLKVVEAAVETALKD